MKTLSEYVSLLHHYMQQNKMHLNMEFCVWEYLVR